MAVRVVFINFATSALRSAQAAICHDARTSGIVSEVIAFDEDKLSKAKEYISLHKDIKEGRAFGYFWWKPYIIRKTLDELSDNDLVFYSDCGKYDGGFRLGSGFRWLVNAYSETGFAGVEVPQFGPSARWTKMDCFVRLSPQIEEDKRLPQIQATFSLWRNTKGTRDFISQWETACRDVQLISDIPSVIPNDPTFVAHRHDQSILSILVRRHGVPFLRPFAPWERPFLRLLERTHEANIGFKRTSFVAKCMRAGFSSPFLVASYIRRKVSKLTSF